MNVVDLAVSLLVISIGHSFGPALTFVYVLFRFLWVLHSPLESIGSFTKLAVYALMTALIDFDYSL